MNPKGRKTSFGGSLLEQVVQSLQMLGFAKAKHNKWAGPRTIVPHWPYTTLYGTKGRYEWCVCTESETIPVECKFQNSSGSTDEKLPYIVLSFVRSEHKEMIVVFGGHYWTNTKRGKGGVQWMRDEAKQIAHRNGKTLHVFNLDQFFLFAKKRWGQR